MRNPKPCPVGCGRLARYGHLTCGPCWREIPRHLQVLVHSTLRTWRADLSNADKLRAYREAADNAVSSIA